MSFGGLGDKDLGLKIRMMNVYWKLGYVSRPNVPVYRYEDGRRTNSPFTDIDILAFRYLPFQEPVVAVCSAKTGSVGDSSQLYWLAGVREHFDATQALYVASQAETKLVRQLSKSLKITVLNHEQLSVMETRLGLKGNHADELVDQKTYEKLDNELKELKAKDRAIFNYLSERYWIDPPYLQLMRSLECANDIAKLNTTTATNTLLRFYASTLAVFAIVRFVSSLVDVPLDSLKKELETELMGGELAQVDKIKVMDKVKQVISEVAKVVSDKPSMPMDIFFDYTKMFRIRYLQDLYDLCVRYLDNFHHMHQIPRLFDFVLFRYELQNEGPSVDAIFEALGLTSRMEKEIVLKLFKDTLVFLMRCGILRENEITDYSLMTV